MHFTTEIEEYPLAWLVILASSAFFHARRNCFFIRVCELVRIRVVLRRSANVQAGTEPIVTAGPVQVDVAQHAVTVNGTAVHLTPTVHQESSAKQKQLPSQH